MQKSLELEEDAEDELLVNVQVAGQRIQAQIDTGAKSVWVSDAWCRRHVGEPELNEEGALSADASALDVTGCGRLTFQWWGRVFKDHPVRVLRGIRTPMMIGLRLQRQAGLGMNLATMRGSYRVEGHLYQGRLYEGELGHDEAVMAIVEDKDVDDAIKATDLAEFSDDAAMRDKLRAVLWKHRDVLKGWAE